MKTPVKAFEVKVGDKILMKRGDWGFVSRVDEVGGQWRILNCADGRKSDQLHVNTVVYVDREPNVKVEPRRDSDVGSDALFGVSPILPAVVNVLRVKRSIALIKEALSPNWRK